VNVAVPLGAPVPVAAAPAPGVPLNGGPTPSHLASSNLASADRALSRGATTEPESNHGRFGGTRSGQFIPSTWARWKADGNSDGVADPQNIDAAALAAGRYLCAGGRNLATGTDWWTAILSYNNSTSYVQTVFNGAEEYARATIH